MNLPGELTLAVKIRRQRKVVRQTRTCKPISGNYCRSQRERMSRELRDITNAL